MFFITSDDKQLFVHKLNYRDHLDFKLFKDASTNVLNVRLDVFPNTNKLFLSGYTNNLPLNEENDDYKEFLGVAKGVHISSYSLDSLVLQSSEYRTLDGSTFRNIGLLKKATSERVLRNGDGYLNLKNLGVVASMDRYTVIFQSFSGSPSIGENAVIMDVSSNSEYTEVMENNGPLYANANEGKLCLLNDRGGYLSKAVFNTDMQCVEYGLFKHGLKKPVSLYGDLHFSYASENIRNYPMLLVPGVYGTAQKVIKINLK